MVEQQLLFVEVSVASNLPFGNSVGMHNKDLLFYLLLF